MEPEKSGIEPIDRTIRWLGVLWPVPELASVSDEEYAVLKARNGWINRVAEILCLLGLAGGVAVPLILRRDLTAWDIAVQFGLAVALPVTWIMASTCPLGRRRFDEFLRWYSLRYGVDGRKLFLWLYGPLVVAGLVGAVKAYAW